MSEYTNGKGIKNGIYWRFIGTTVVVLLVLQLIAFYTKLFTVINSMPLAVLAASYVVAPRVKERRLLNTWLAVIITFILGLIAEFVLQPLAQVSTWQLIYTNGFVLVLGLAMGWMYLRLTMWSEKKRSQYEAKRKEKVVADSPAVPIRRHGYKKKKKKGRRK